MNGLAWLDGAGRLSTMCTYGDSVEAIGFQFRDVCRANAVGLDGIDVYDEYLPTVR